MAILKLHPEGGDSTGGGEGSTGGDGKPADGAAGAGGEGAKSGGDAGQKGQEGNEPQYVTSETLKGVMASSQKALTKELSGLISPLKTQLETQSAELKELRTAPKEPEKGPKGGDGKSSDNANELAELRRTVDEQKTAISKAQTEIKSSKETANSTRFNQIVLDALTRAECRKPQAVLRMIAPDLEYDPEKDADRVFVTVKSEFGEEELELDKYIKREVAEKDMPELFEGKHRPGSPAGGDQGGGDGEFLFTMEQVKDPKFYVKHADAIRTALEQGKVKGARSGSS